MGRLRKKHVEGALRALGLDEALIGEILAANSSPRAMDGAADTLTALGYDAQMIGPDVVYLRPAASSTEPLKTPEEWERVFAVERAAAQKKARKLEKRGAAMGADSRALLASLGLDEASVRRDSRDDLSDALGNGEYGSVLSEPEDPGSLKALIARLNELQSMRLPASAGVHQLHRAAIQKIVALIANHESLDEADEPLAAHAKAVAAEKEAEERELAGEGAEDAALRTVLRKLG